MRLHAPHTTAHRASEAPVALRWPARVAARAEQTWEAEADRAADRALAAPRPLHDIGKLGRAPDRTPPTAAPSGLAGSGRALDPPLRAEMESAFKADFSSVRVHDGGAAHQSAATQGARAYASGGHLVFGAGQYQPATPVGRRLLAHELAHVLQQRNSDTAPRLQRAGFESTVEVCHRVLESRHFSIDQGGLRVVFAAQSPDTSVPNCRDFDFGVSLTRSEDWWPDQPIGTCESSTGGIRVFSFADLPQGTYYLTFWRVFDHRHCCLTGDVFVFDEAQAGDTEGCHRAKDLSTMDIVHGALDLAGFIPALGAIPDGINAGIYAVEGDWVNAGLSAIAAVPAWGDGIKLTTMMGKSMIKVEARAAVKLGEEGLSKELKAMKAASKSDRAAAKAANKADDEALDLTFSGGKGEGAYPTTPRLARGNLGERLATEALAADGHKVLNYKPDIRGTNQGGIDTLTFKDGFVYFVDNKALTRAGNVSSVSALTTNFAKNKAAVLAELKTALKAAPTKEQKDLLQSAITAIESKSYKRVVTNANLTRDDAILTGVTESLRKQGIEFIDVFKLGSPK